MKEKAIEKLKFIEPMILYNTAEEAAVGMFKIMTEEERKIVTQGFPGLKTYQEYGEAMKELGILGLL